MKRFFTLLSLSLLFSLLLCVQASAESTAETNGSHTVLYILIALAIGLAAAGITLFLMCRSMSTVRKQKRADAYADEGSFALSECRDVYLYSRVTRVRINTNNNKR